MSESLYVHEFACLHCLCVTLSCLLQSPNLCLPLIHSDLSMIGEQMSWLQLLSEAASLLSPLFSRLSSLILIPMHCYGRGGEVTRTAVLAQTMTANRRPALSLLLWSKIRPPSCFYYEVISIPLIHPLVLPGLHSKREAPHPHKHQLWDQSGKKKTAYESGT